MRSEIVFTLVVLIGITLAEEEQLLTYPDDEVYEMIELSPSKRSPSPQLHSSGDRIRLLMWKPKIGKRSTTETRTVHSINVPRGGLLISGRGYMPGFIGERLESFFVKRSASLEEDRGEPEVIPSEMDLETPRRIPQFYPRIYRFQRYI